MDPNIVWGGLLITGAAYEGYAIFSRKSGDTLSERTRSWFRTRTKTGKAVFSVAWISFAAWYLIHIIGG